MAKYVFLRRSLILEVSDRWSPRLGSTAAGFGNMMLTELSLKWCWKIFNLVHCLQAAEALRQNLLNKESLVLHKGLEMWAMDSASLYSGESIITEDATQDRENRHREREGERDREQTRDGVKRERGRQGAEERCWCFHCCRLLPCWVSEGMQGETILWGGGGKSAFWWGFDGVQQEHQPIVGSLGLFAQSYGAYWVGGWPC